MSSRSSSARSVFVGNIPYSATEEQLEDVFRTVGHVVSFRWGGNPRRRKPCSARARRARRRAPADWRAPRGAHPARPGVPVRCGSGPVALRV